MIKNKGMTLFIAIVIMSILLFITFAVVNITMKSALFASSGRDSQFAFYAADSGVECALYWDTRFDPSKFDTSASGSPINCGGVSISDGQSIPGTSTPVQIGGGSSSGSGSGVYDFKRSIAINHTKVPSNQSSFPVLVCANGSASCNASVPGLNQTGGGAHVQNANGYDIGFYSDNNCTAKLPWEMEKYVPGTGEMEAWVNVPSVNSISDSSDTTIYMCYGSTSITTDQSNKTAVWDANYKGVWHLANPTNPTDSTGVNNATNNGATATAGQIDGAANFSNQNITGTDNFPMAGSDITVSFWLFMTGHDAWAPIVGKTDTNNSGLHDWSVIFNAGGNNVYLIRNGGNQSASNAGFPTSVWTYFTGTMNATASKIYFNGTIDGTQGGIGSGNTLNTAGRYFSIGGISFPTYVSGKIDEVRVSNSIRTADWIKTEYNNQSSPAIFDPIGGEVTGSFGSGGGGSGGSSPFSTFYFNMNQGSNPVPYCSIVTVTKNAGTTHINSRGYNTCDTSSPRRVERGVEVTY